MGHHRGLPAPEAWNQSIGTMIAPAVEPLTPDTPACSDSTYRLLERVSCIQIANETESADDFRVVRLRNCTTQLLVSKMAYNRDSSRSHTNRDAPEGQELALDPTRRAVRGETLFHPVQQSPGASGRRLVVMPDQTAFGGML